MLRKPVAWRRPCITRAMLCSIALALFCSVSFWLVPGHWAQANVKTIETDPYVWTYSPEPPAHLVMPYVAWFPRIQDRHLNGTDVCTAERAEMFQRALTETAERIPTMRAAAFTNKETIARVERNLKGLRIVGQKAQDYMKKGWDLFDQIHKYDAQHLLSTQETWTDLDTELLLELDPRPGAWTDEASLTTEGFRKRLPRLADLRAHFREGSVAIVGSGRSIRGKGLGSEIDGHPQVVRINTYQLGVDTGNRTTLHAANLLVRGVEGTPLVDMETSWPFDSHIVRYDRLSEAASVAVSTQYVLRPSAICGMANLKNIFTRGFLLIWFVGTLFGNVDLYGFAASSGKDKAYGPGEEREKYIEFEHHFYEALAKVLQKRPVVGGGTFRIRDG